MGKEASFYPDEVVIRPERPAEYIEVEALVEAAFRLEEMSDQSEHRLVRRLRESEAFVPELSLVAETDELCGHILLTRVTVGASGKVLALAPMSVHPFKQRSGIGSALIEEALLRAEELGFELVVLLGHPEYYPRFGFEPAGRHGITAPFDVPAEAWMVKELVPGALSWTEGTVQYPDAFFTKEG
ncbi:GNAT family N-acetyltransferase [Alkalicoccus urumqiensis]|uniref:GNAT family N-acetyltransferase n=1 Tax=Alkalicoccus urumqiensis TaxID=1548213 RepID=A0A2P6MLZ5_ALKUR|nr:N-acetyltransferase [Alkalicoccus urumqiensis]PRO67313.1 GNAT family N-acetyltransferase [Alkalicoccus urumqiensis]